MKQLAAGFYLLKKRLGLAGLLGLLGILIALGLLVLQVLPMRKNLQALTEQLETAQRTPRQETRLLPQLADDEAALANFYAQFATIKELPEILQTMSDTAAKQGLKLDKADFLLAREQQGALMRYEITLPVKAGYPLVRRYVDSLARLIPTMALTEINLKREGAHDEALEAKLAFVLYLRDVR